MFIGAVLFALMLGLRAASHNRHMRSRLTVSAVAFAAYEAFSIVLASGRVSPVLAGELGILQPLLLAFGVINAVVALVINRWKADRPPERFPTILQDAIVIVLFALTATYLLEDRIFAATAAGAVVVGLALQDTLGNLFAGLAIQIEKPFRVGHWVQIAGIDGQVTEVTWRATKVRTKADNFVIVPNSKLSGDVIVNYSEPDFETRIAIDVGVSYDAAPNDVKAAILEAIRDEPLVARSRKPEVLITDFGGSSVMYRLHVWITDFGTDEHLHDRIRSHIYYCFRRKRIEIPYPIQIEYSREEVPFSSALTPVHQATMHAVPIFAALSEEDKSELARAATAALYAAGEVVVREGDPGRSMFVLSRGSAVVQVGASGQEVARIGPGGFFGEMSLLTGAPRNATVVTLEDSELLEIDVEPFRRFVLANPAAVEHIGAAVAKRRAELEERRAAGAVAVPVEAPQTLINRIRKFLFST